jgi:hypothetical protein
MKTLILFFILCTLCFADTNSTTSPTNYPYLNQYDILNKYTEENFYLKRNNIIITGEFLKDYTLNRVTSFTTLKIQF